MSLLEVHPQRLQRSGDEDRRCHGEDMSGNMTKAGMLLKLSFREKPRCRGPPPGPFPNPVLETPEQTNVHLLLFSP